ncbi:MAG: M14 family zinc carboxypeptidase [Planctomycetota bacterium]
MNSFRRIKQTGRRTDHPRIYTYFPVAAAMGMCLLLGSCAASAQASAKAGGFVEQADFDPAVPSPESVIGHAVADKAVRYAALERYLQALAEASELVTLTSYGQSHEGRALYYLTITSQANHRRLEQIKADNGKLSDPRKLDGAGQADKLVDNLPAVAWLNYSIHGDELSSTEAALYVAYHLAAAKDPANRKLLDEVVVHLNPLVNPDGRERYLSHLEQLTGVVSSPDIQSMQHQALWSRGRGNHYLFDLNRDWLVHLQPEVRALAESVLSWNPHLLVDSHEQNALDTYLFDPPRDPINLNLSPKVMDWRKRFSQDQADAFNRYGWSYYTRDWYLHKRLGQYARSHRAALRTGPRRCGVREAGDRRGDRLPRSCASSHCQHLSEAGDRRGDRLPRSCASSHCQHLNQSRNITRQPARDFRRFPCRQAMGHR